MKPTKKTTIVEAIKHKQLLGSLPAFQSLDTWGAWITWLKAVFCLPMTDGELEVFRQCTGRQAPPTKEPQEVFSICGRRGGKSFISSLTAVYTACFNSYERYLNAGERAVLLLLARDKDQARILFNYIQGILHTVAPFAQMIVNEKADEIELDNRVTIMVKTSDFRAIRGISVALAILDEFGFFDVEGVSPDREILVALRPAMATIPNSRLLAISTPYAQSGAMYEAHRDHYGRDDEHVLVWQADTRAMNPTIDEGLIQRELERDPDGASAEWLATFRTDLSAAFSPESLEACTIKGRSELPASPIIQYQAFTDPSGGKHDSFTVSIGHKENGKAIVDLVRAWQPPFDPGVVTGEIAEVLKGYGVSNVTGDNYAGEWPVASFRNHGVAYERCEKSKSELYLAFVPVTNSGGVELPEDKRLLTQLRRLERKRGRAGKDTVDHPPRLHDDLANSVAGVSYLLINAEASQNHGGFNAAKHIAQGKLVPIRGAAIGIGITLTSPTASVLGQADNHGGIQIFAAFVSQGGLEDHIQTRLRPWLYQNAGWALNDWQKLLGCYEDIDQSAEWNLAAVVTEALPGEWHPAAVPIEARRESVLSALSKAQTFTFQPAFQVDPDAELIAPALSRPYDPKDKSVYAAVANALGLLISRMAPGEPQGPLPKIHVRMDFNALDRSTWAGGRR